MANKPAGAPMWMATFADMMSLLMCFFVLLLSFSEMDIEKYKQIAGSLKMAFGVQRTIDAEEAPKGKSAIVGNLSPGGSSATRSPDVAHEAKQAEESEEQADQQRVQEKLDENLKQIKEALAREIREGKVDVIADQGRITLRIQEKSAFPSGSADVVRSFSPILKKIQSLLAETDGGIAVAGHTDNRPIRTRRYRSNWELSASRAVTVVHHLLKDSTIPHERIQVRGYGDAQPLVPNDTDENRATNRRVEIVVTALPAKPPAQGDEAAGGEAAGGEGATAGEGGEAALTDEQKAAAEAAAEKVNDQDAAAPAN